MPESFVCGAIDNYNSKKTSIDFKKFLQFFSNRESVVNKFSQRKTIKKVRCNWKILTRFIFSFRPSEIDNSHSTKRVIDPSVLLLRNRSFFNAWNRDSQLDIGPDVHGHNISRKRRACPPFTATDNTRFN